MDEEEERRKRRREKNKVAAARCRNKKKERTEFLQRESERLEMMNAELKAQIEELKLERQQLIVMLNRHRPTCIVRTDSVKTPESGQADLLVWSSSAGGETVVEILYRGSSFQVVIISKLMLQVTFQIQDLSLKTLLKRTQLVYLDAYKFCMFFSKDSSDDMKKVLRREKNRLAAQKSRMRQTQKADTLHLESENLEKENAALRKEIKRLTEEAKYLSAVLSSHEPLCSAVTLQASDIVYSSHGPFHQTHISSSRFQH
ncbi:BATF factor, partial [Polypterus senegalus]